MQGGAFKKGNWGAWFRVKESTCFCGNGRGYSSHVGLEYVLRSMYDTLSEGIIKNSFSSFSLLLRWGWRLGENLANLACRRSIGDTL